jgi:ribosomal protein S18 acetylase RimI-like enzyme
VRVRPAQERDAGAIAAVHVRSWQAAYRGLVPDDVLDALSIPRREASWLQTLRARAGLCTLVADEDGSIAGFCTVVLPSRDADAGPLTGEIAALYVDPPRWRAGTGTALLLAALAALESEGCSEVTLWVIDGNLRGREFYRRFGFKADGGRREERGEPSQVRLRAALPVERVL